MKVKELLANPEAWTKEFYAQTADGFSVFPEDENAVSFCLLGAVQRCYLEDADRKSVISDLRSALRKKYGVGCITDFNDRIAKHSDIIAICEEMNI